MNSASIQNPALLWYRMQVAVVVQEKANSQIVAVLTVNRVLMLQEVKNGPVKQ